MQTRTTLRRPWFFNIMGGIALLAVAIGFGRTYIVPMSRGTFAAPLWVHRHGAFALAWILLFFAQPVLVPAGVYQATHEAAAGLGPTGISSLLGVLTAAAIFVALISAGVATCRAPTSASGLCSRTSGSWSPCFEIA